MQKQKKQGFFDICQLKNKLFYFATFDWIKYYLQTTFYLGIGIEIYMN